MRIAWKLGFALAAAGALPTAVAGVLAIRFGERELLSHEMASEQRAARSASELVNQQFNSLRGRFEAAALAFDLDANYGEQEFVGYAQLAAKAAPGVRAVMLFNLDKVPLLSEPVYALRGGRAGIPAPDLTGLLRYVRVDAPRPDFVLGGLFPSAEDGAPLGVFTLVRFIPGKDGAEARGWAVAWLVDLSDLKAKLESAALGPGESLALVDEKLGSIFAPAAASARGEADFSRQLLGAIPSRSGAALWPRPEGDLIVAAEPVPGKSWTVFVHRPSADALAAARRLRNQVALVWGAIAVVCSLAAAIFLARGIARPLRALSKAALAVAAGQRHGAIPASGGGELEELAKSFNVMSTEVAKAEEQLQAKITERTAALEASNGKLQVLADNLARFLPAQFVGQLFYSPSEPMRLAHRRVRLTIAFADLVGFTDASDQLEPEQLTRVVNNFFEEMTAISESHGGTVAKFMGDAVMVFFGDPEFISDEIHALACVKMALTMQERISELGQGWARDGIEHPPLMRIGINTGYAAVGLFGSGNRTEYTAIGRQVNLTSRLQTAAQPGQVILSHPTYALVKDKIEAESLGEVQVKGIARPITLYRLLKLAEAQAKSAAS